MRMIYQHYIRKPLLTNNVSDRSLPLVVREMRLRIPEKGPRRCEIGTRRRYARLTRSSPVACGLFIHSVRLLPRHPPSTENYPPVAGPVCRARLPVVMRHIYDDNSQSRVISVASVICSGMPWPTCHAWPCDGRAPRLAEWAEENLPEGLMVMVLPGRHQKRLRTTNAWNG